MHTITENQLRNRIFSWLTINNAIALRMVSKGWSVFIWEYLLSSADTEIRNWQYNYFVQSLAESDAIFHSRELPNRPAARHNAMHIFYEMLLELRMQNRSLFISDHELNRILATIAKEEKNSIQLLHNIHWTLSPRQKILMEKTIQSFLQEAVLSICGKQCTENTLKKIVYLRKSLSSTQRYTIISSMTTDNIANKFSYNPTLVFQLFHDLESKYIDTIIKNTLNTLQYFDDKTVRLNMMVLFRCCMHRRNAVEPTFILEKFQYCIKDKDRDIRFNILQTLQDFARYLSDKTALLKTVKLLWNDQEKDIHDMALQIYINHQPGFSYDEVIAFWRKKCMNDEKSINNFFSTLTSQNQEQFNQCFLEQFSKDLQNNRFYTLNMTLLEHLTFSAQQWKYLIGLIEQQCKSKETDQQISMIYILKIICGRMRPEEMNRFIPMIQDMMESNRPEFVHPLLELFEKSPDITNVLLEKKGLYFIFKALMVPNPFTYSQAMQTLIAIRPWLDEQQKKAILKELNRLMAVDFEQAVQVLEVFMRCMDTNFKIKAIDSLLAGLKVRENSYDSLVLFHSLRQVLDPIHLTKALTAIQQNLLMDTPERTIPLKNRRYALDMFFAFVDIYKETSCIGSVDILDVVHSLELFLKHAKYEHRVFAMEKIILLLKSNLFSENIQSISACAFFGKTNKYIESLTVNLVAQSSLLEHSDKDFKALLEAHSQHFLKKNMPAQFGFDAKNKGFTKAALIHTEYACNLLYQMLHQKDSAEEKVHFIDQVRGYPVFKPVSTKLINLRTKIKNSVLDVRDFVLIQEPGPENSNEYEGFYLV